jgi:fibronectin type 3 domain-containing protein
MKKLLIALALSLASLTTQARNVTLAWDAEPDAKVIAYTVTYFQEGAGTSQTVTVGPTERQANITVTAGQWSAYVVAVGNTGLPSDPSNVVDIFIPIPPANLRIVVE